MRVVITMDGYEVYRGTVAECAEFLRAWAIVSTTAVRVVDAGASCTDASCTDARRPDSRRPTIIEDATLFGARS